MTQFPSHQVRQRIEVERVYATRSGRGKRFLVERLWPRGIRKEDLQIDGWVKDAAPSTSLRQWFAHDPAKWEEFKKRYFGELDARPEAWRPLIEASLHGPVVLLFSARDIEHNNAVALREYLETQAP
jgi:uncharacterized protein YeaO (DUF488 family)